MSNAYSTRIISRGIRLQCDDGVGGERGDSGCEGSIFLANYSGGGPIETHRGPDLRQNQALKTRT